MADGGSTPFMLSAEMAEPEGMTRRDFLNGTLLASGAALVSAACPFQLMAAEDWNGDSGYRRLCRCERQYAPGDGRWSCDSRSCLRSSEANNRRRHGRDLRLRSGGWRHQRSCGGALSTSGQRRAKKSCLVLENHPIFGGEAKRNEFSVDGQHADRKPGIGDVVSADAGKLSRAFL